MHQKRERFLWEFVYGWIDGTVTTFAVVAWATWWNLSTDVILILWFANLIADGVSMSIGNYLSTKAEIAQYVKEHWHTRDTQLPPRQTALATFAAFVTLWFMPLLVYVIQYLGWNINPDNLFLWGSIITGLTFVCIWWTKWVITHTSILKSTWETVGLWAIAAMLSYYVGNVLEQLITK